MGTQLSNRLDRGRAKRKQRPFAPSTFSVFLIGFGICYWLFHFYTAIATIECEYAVIWVSGWFKFHAAFQWLAVAIGAAALVWLVRAITLKDLHRFETAAQLIFILGLAGALLAQKAFLFPYGTPSAAQVERVAHAIWPSRLRLNEEHDALVDRGKDWKYDYPPPPFSYSPEPPWLNAKINKRIPEIFSEKGSPLPEEYAKAQQCYAGYRAALVQYEADMKRWSEYWAGFREWYVVNRWRYEE